MVHYIILVENRVRKSRESCKGCINWP